MIKDYQVTLYCPSGKYKPVSCIIKKDSAEIKTKGKTVFIEELKKSGIQKICNKRYWGNKELKMYGYTSIKVREYNLEEIKKSVDKTKEE